MWWLPFAAAAVSSKSQHDNAVDENKLRALQTRYSPWSGIEANTNLVRTSPFGDLAAGALDSAAAYQNEEDRKMLHNMAWQNMFNNLGKANVGNEANPNFVGPRSY